MTKQTDAARLIAEYDEDEWIVGTMQWCGEAAAELHRLSKVEIAFQEFIDKTDWVQQTCAPSELGMHRADILKHRIDRLHGANQMLLEALGLFNITCGHLHHDYEDRHEHDDCPVVRKVYAAIAKAGNQNG